MVLEREEKIIVATSGSKAVYLEPSDLGNILKPYAEASSVGAKEALKTMWVDIQYPSYETMHTLMTYFHLHSLTVEDCLSDSEKAVQKMELFDRYRFVSFAEHHVIPFTNIWTSIDAHLILPSGLPVLIAIHNGPVSYVCRLLNRIQALTPLDKTAGRGDKKSRRRIAGRSVIQSSEWLLYAIMDQIVDQFMDLTSECAYEVDQLESLVFELPPREQSDFLRRIGAVRNRISVLRLQLARKREVVAELLEIAHHPQEYGMDNSFSSIKVFVRDIADHIEVMLADLEQDKDTLHAITTAFLSRVETAMSTYDQLQSKIVKRFSAIATIILPLTFIAGAFGMNVPIPEQFSSPDHHWMFFSIIGGMGIFSAIFGTLFWWIGWI